jgi:hypothetical protein
MIVCGEREHGGQYGGSAAGEQRSLTCGRVVPNRDDLRYGRPTPRPVTQQEFDTGDAADSEACPQDSRVPPKTGAKSREHVTRAHQTGTEA